MKRSKVVQLIAAWGSEGILEDVYYKNYEEWADNLLHVLEDEIGMLPPAIEVKDPGHFKGDQFTYQVNEWEQE